MSNLLCLFDDPSRIFSDTEVQVFHEEGWYIMDVNGDGIFNTTDAGYARMTASPIELRFTTKDNQVRRGNDGVVDKLAKLPQLLVRPGWRQLK